MDSKDNAVTADPNGVRKIKFLLDASILHELQHLYLGRLGDFQEYRQTLVSKLRVLGDELRSTESLLYTLSYDALQESQAASDELTDFTGLEPSVCVPSLDLPFPVLQGYAAWEDLCISLAQVAHETRALFGEVLRKLRRTAIVIADLLAAVPFAVPFFCSQRWERRRWFLLHGARPPKQRGQAMLSLFGGACSRPSIAY